MLATADLDDKLIVRLWPIGNEKDKRRIEIALADLVAGSPKYALDSQGNQLLVSRSPGDKLASRFRASHWSLRPAKRSRPRSSPTNSDCPPALR